jgi:nitrogen fixation/metabolism regulation signal transduction histidine kinase
VTVTNPIMLVITLALLLSVLAFMTVVAVSRHLRRHSLADSFMTENAPALEQLPLHTYNQVIQQLKQQKHELLTLQQSERRRAKTSENISAAVLSNLTSGVVFLTPNGLVRRTNAAARNLLGYASPGGINVAELFRDAKVTSGGAASQLSEVVQAAVREQDASQCVTALYKTPSGESRVLDVTITCVRSQTGEVLGTACLINDKTEVTLLHQQKELHGEMSSEMALALRTSLATISGYARQLAGTADPRLTGQLAADIVSEAAELDHTIGGFLAGARASAKSAGA